MAWRTVVIVAFAQSRNVVRPLRDAGWNYKQMKDLSNNAVNRITVGDEGAGQRIDNFLVRVLKGVPKSHIYRILRSGEVRRNGGRVGPDARLDPGDELRIPPIRVVAPARGPVPRDLEVPPILFEDDWLLALDKPAGVAVHGGSGISHGVIERLRLARPEARFLELVHRLDRETSGVLLIAKKRPALVDLHAQIREGKVDKRYWVLAVGRWRDAVRRVDAPLASSVGGEGERRVRVDRAGREASTVFRLVRAWRDLEPPLALLEAELETGRTHQIRVHLAHIGYPLARDSRYGDFARNRDLQKIGLKRMFLHAHRMAFVHPETCATVALESPMPPELASFVGTLDVADARRRAS